MKVRYFLLTVTTLTLFIVSACNNNKATEVAAPTHTETAAPAESEPSQETTSAPAQSEPASEPAQEQK